ncbi:MAG: hypothetical protein EOO43_11945, partial [Flavobacterium sp.]
MKIYFTLFIVCIASCVLAQTTLTGKVIDEKTNRGIPGASVYLNNSTFGAQTDSDGNFSFNCALSGKMTLIVSHVAYQRQVHIIEDKNSKNLIFSLKPEINSLNEVIIKSTKYSKANLTKWINLFTYNLIGAYKGSSYLCKITNKEALYFDFDESTNNLKVLAREPLIIINDFLNYKIKIEELPEPRVAFTNLSKDAVHKYHQVFGYTREDIETIIKPMAVDGKEPIGSMGTDVPLAVLSDRPQHLSSYFKQFFAQVTNPPIDPIRERMVMSLATFIGSNGNLFDEDKMHCHCVALQQPILTNTELEKLRSIDTGMFNAKTLQTYFKADGQAGSLQQGLERLCRYAEDAVNDGFE